MTDENGLKMSPRKVLGMMALLGAVMSVVVVVFLYYFVFEGEVAGTEDILLLCVPLVPAVICAVLGILILKGIIMKDLESNLQNRDGPHR